MPRLSREQAIDEMVRGGLLYVYVENPDHSFARKSPVAGSGAVVGDYGLSHIGRRTVRAIQRLGTRWSYENRAEILTEDAVRRACYGSSPLWMWSQH
jgi:hypothetical protein